MSNFVEQLKELRWCYDFGIYNHELVVNMAIGKAMLYIGEKRWTAGYENIIRNLFPVYSRMVVKSVQPNGYDTDKWVKKIYFVLCK